MDFLNYSFALAFAVFVTHAGRRHDDDAATAVHPGGDGPGADGEEPVQREADGAAGGRAVDRNDQAGETKMQSIQNPNIS